MIIQRLKKVLLFSSCLIMMASVSANEDEIENVLIDGTNPYVLIKKVAQNTFKRLDNDQLKIDADLNVLKVVVREELMPYINHKYSAYKVIGSHLKKTSPIEREAFAEVFREYLITSYAQVFTLYDNQPVEFFPEKAFADKKIIAVNTRLKISGRDDIDISFKMRKNRKTNEWKAFDMVAEGVSLLDAKKAELGGLIRQKGITYVTELLKQKSKQNIKQKLKK
jgi:phospholipid transport system substrate-binding protein